MFYCNARPRFAYRNDEEVDLAKKNVLFIMPSMFIGGAERSLLGLLDSFDYSNFDVNLFLYRHEGEFMGLIPKQVHILPEMKQYQTFDVPVKRLLHSSQFIFGCARLVGKLAKFIHTRTHKEPAGIWMSMQYTSKYLLPLLPKIPGQYDMAIMFLGIGDVLAQKVNARIKITWNHTDYSILYPNTKYDLQIYSHLDYVASVSEPCTAQLLNIHPSLKTKAITIENILSERLLLQQAQEATADMPKNKEKMILLSIGRYSNAKNFDNIPEICKYIVSQGIKVIWYIIGYGGDESLIKQRIIENEMEEHVVLLGKKVNPYPYINACDIYVQPSRYEGKCVTVREAQILHKPVIITNYATSSSQLKDGYDGIIVPMDNEKCAVGIAKVIRDKELQKRLIENTKKSDYSNQEEIEKIYQLIG